VPSDDAKVSFIAHGIVLLGSAFAVATLEQRGLGDRRLVAMLVAGLIVLGHGIGLAAHLAPAARVTVDLDEAAPLPTQRLNLA
jgi:hypothetical protein